MKFARFAVSLLTLTFSCATAKVIEATDKNVNELLASGVPAILDIYASWCGHCQRFAPVFDELAALYEDTPETVQFIKIDGDKHRKVAKQFKVEYFPTIKWVAADGSHEEINQRTVEGLQALIAQKTNTAVPGKQSNGSPASESHVIDLDDSTFEDGVDQKHALVAFTATWCGHCKHLKPEWEKLAEFYKNDKDIAIVNVDCTGDDAESLSETFKVTGFPTIIYFPKDDEAVPQPYVGGRLMEDFIAHFQRVGASHRQVDGTLGAKAGVIDSIVEHAPSVVGSGSDSAVVQKVKQLIKSSGSDLEQKYLKVVDKVSSDATYIEKEIARVSKLIHDKAINPLKKDELSLRLNILRLFSPESDSVYTPPAEDVEERDL